MFVISCWTAIPSERSYGVAIHNFQEVGEYRIKLTVGECVRILKECKNWYYGYSGKNKTLLGIFPKSFIHIMDSSFRDTAYGTYVYGNQPHIVSEVTSVLREWELIWKKLYMTHSPHFKQIECMMYELIKLRAKILSGTLPVDELKEVQRSITWYIDVGNKLLGLDMVVRDEQGNILNPDRASVIELFRQHESATERIRNSSLTPDNNRSYQVSPQSHNYTFFLSVRNLICKSTDDVELLFALYDQKLCEPFSENFVLKWNREMLASDSERFFNFRALFTDLGNREISKEKVYLVCYIVRNGHMDLDTSSRFSLNKDGNADSGHMLRRPYAVTCFNLYPHFSGKSKTDEEEPHFLPLLPCEKDTLEGTLKRYWSLKELPIKDSKSQGVVISFRLIQGDLKQVREEFPHLIIGNVATVRKMGFPDVILPGDVRNDLYLTLSYGEFSRGTKTSDKNIETLISVCNEKGVPLQGGVILGGGGDPQTEYRSVVYYHNDKPKWSETFKIVVSIEEFKNCHLRFLFKHRSSKNETKDKNDKPFALSYVRLMQKNGTTLRDDSQHDLSIYKIDPKKYDSTDISYLQLASTKTDLHAGVKAISSAFSLHNKDFLVIRTKVCSTKLTQNVDLLGLLNWSNEPDNIAGNLRALMNVEGEEVVKFLQDVLDTLFNILTLNKDPDLYDNIVFDCLLYVVSLMLDRKYFNFQPVLTLYIEESFCAPLAYNKLIIVLQENIRNVQNREKNMLKMMKSLKYIMKFITRSRLRCSQLNDGRGQEAFEDSFTDLMKAIAGMMQHTSDDTLLIQAACLKYIPSTIPDIMIVFNPVKLSVLLMELINNLPNARLTKQKMMTINDIVHSPLFLNPDCRDYLLKKILILVKQLLESSEEGKFSADRRRYKSKSVAKIAKVLGASSSDLLPQDVNVSQLELCIKILCDIMDLLFQPQSGDTSNDITEIILTILRTVIQTTIRMDRESSLVDNLTSVMISIFRQMSEQHFVLYIDHFNTRSDLLDFLMEILLVFKDLISRPVYPTDWSEMILLQNNVILKSLKNFSHTIRDYFFEPFEHQVWNNFFHCAISFLTQPALQLEKFSQCKKWGVITRYKDMRRIAGLEIRNMWFNLGQNKKQFVPQLVGPLLEMTLIPEEELRKATIPIFFDMMQSEFYSTRNGVEQKRDCNTLKANFCEFENEMIAKLDNMVEGGSGDEQYKDLFYSIMINFCEKHTVMRDQGVKFVMTVTRLMERLLEYRCIINDESKENRMICTVNLLDFYNQINRKEMYIRYVNKLCALHLECENYPEAAYTLRLHSKLLTWTDEPLTFFLRSLKYPQCETHRELKEALYQDMIKYFDKGKMWECAILVCKELMRLYEEETFDYGRLSALHRRMSQFYDCITTQVRPNPEYFRVAYYGKGFPSFLSNKVFIHRGKEYDRLSDFCSRMMNQHLNAELMNKLSPPTDQIKESPGQYMQINCVEPIMDERKQKLLNKTIHERILWYHRVNEVQHFQYSRPIRAENEDENVNLFANLWLERTVLEISSPLPGVLRWFPVVNSDTYLISPLKNAIETMQETNKKLREMIISYRNDRSLPLSPLGMKLKGIVDAAVQGGIINYEQAFFGTNYLEKHPEEVELVQELKDLIASQIPLLDIGIQIHGERAPPSLAPFQEHIEDQFDTLKTRVEEKYGKKVSDIKYESIRYRRRVTGNSFSHSYSDKDRLSQASVGSIEISYQLKNSLISSSSVSSSIAVLAGPVLPSYSISPQKFGTITSLTRKEKKEKNKRRNRTESKISMDSESNSSKDSFNRANVSNSQWYDDEVSTSLNSLCSLVPASPKLDLNSSEAKSSDSPKSDNDKEKVPSSRPSSDSSFNQSDQMSILSNITRDSYDSTTTSEDDRIPPPLPAKNREVTDNGVCSNEIVDLSSRPSPYDTCIISLQSPNDKPVSVINNTSDETSEVPPTPPPRSTNLLNHSLL